MKRVLGMMLASRMAGRGARRGRGGGGLGGGGLAGLAAAGMLGGRRGGLGRKAGIAALGYMAYRAYRDRQDGPASRSGAPGDTGSDTGSAGTGEGDGLGGVLNSIKNAFTGGQDPQPAREAAGSPDTSDTPYTLEDERAAEAFSEDTALLLIQAMVAAANADGVITAEERARIKAQTDQGGATAEDARAIDRELANPQPLDDLLRQVRDQETAEAFYLASRMAVDDGNETSRAYLVTLRARLGLGEQEAAEIDALAQ